LVVATPPKDTSETDRKLRPVRVSVSPTRALGVKPETHGAVWKSPTVAVTPALLVTVMGPVMAPGGTTASAEPSVTVSSAARMPSKNTPSRKPGSSGSLKLAPVNSTRSPGAPRTLSTSVWAPTRPHCWTTGGTWKFQGVWVCPRAFSTRIGPMVAPTGTRTEI